MTRFKNTTTLDDHRYLLKRSSIYLVCFLRVQTPPSLFFLLAVFIPAKSTEDVSLGRVDKSRGTFSRVSSAGAARETEKETRKRGERERAKGFSRERPGIRGKRRGFVVAARERELCHFPLSKRDHPLLRVSAVYTREEAIAPSPPPTLYRTGIFCAGSSDWRFCAAVRFD